MEYQPRTDFQRRQVKAAARLFAMADQVAEGIGREPKCTRRTLTALEKTAEAKLAQLRAIQNGQSRDRDPVVELLAAHNG